MYICTRQFTLASFVKFNDGQVQRRPRQQNSSNGGRFFSGGGSIQSQFSSKILIYWMMTYNRNWDDTCPREWDRWEQDGTIYVIQDLPPEDDEEAVKILVEVMLSDEVLFSLSDVSNDPESVQSVSDNWMAAVKQRMSLACYAEKDGHRRLVALNVCVPKQKDNKKLEVVGRNWKNVYEAAMYLERKAKSLETLGLDLALTAYGLVVVKEYRGAKLGYKILAAREPMCRFLGIKGSTTMFTCIAAQKLAERAGYKSIVEVPIKELAEIGLDYPKDDERLIKIMIRRYE